MAPDNFLPITQHSHFELCIKCGIAFLNNMPYNVIRKQQGTASKSRNFLRVAFTGGAHDLPSPVRAEQASHFHYVVVTAAGIKMDSATSQICRNARYRK